MNGTRRALLSAMGGAGLLLAAAPTLAAEDAAPGPKGWSGVDLQIAGGVASIRELDPFGPAARAGLRPGDLVIGCNGGGLGQLPVALGGPPGEQVELAVLRGQSLRTVRLVLEVQESARP
ncbi:PDZ domain-containing protein [Caulobacter sp. NIBR1757]|uniref:PDZ domain-containing protein n=1 Tax=Caulobacter sp. NIBR1757 TaxID=3016000 RepID=UPI0022F084E1|nr:PDZ domain-containing protein [Caulobacter sp. NIBR1757]WGM40265.1 hypothetical protein AMEJIAPC_03208 [Caulobacter sp. NIBR1757]